MELTGGPETKKARWSPNSFTNSPNVNGASRDLFANYGYGNQAAINQPANGFANGLGMNGANGLGLGANQLYSTPSLSVNTATNGMGSMGSQISPSSATSPFTTMQQHQNGQVQNGGYGGAAFGSYGMNGMLGMGMGMLSGFPYSPQLGSFQQVRIFHFLVIMMPYSFSFERAWVSNAWALLMSLRHQRQATRL